MIKKNTAIKKPGTFSEEFKYFLTQLGGPATEETLKQAWASLGIDMTKLGKVNLSINETEKNTTEDTELSFKETLKKAWGTKKDMGNPADWVWVDDIHTDPPIPTKGEATFEKNILEEAIELTGGDRRRDYDHALPNHERIATLWNAYIGIRKHSEAPLTPADVATMMLLLKVARHAHNPKRDNLVDMAGYARCLAQIEGMEP